ncbi:bifunctional ADP-dependent NAD(P)H-hydrate dehydratase/NAD(P)H-hydrate epimerase [Psychrobacter piscatorii]|uniref:ADP-dependent (S)-NAD(P)H-hydrate dehydratase n=1 Tax=Psychrobacter piscatorii TaxID=554343 RepID=A0A0T6DPD0_9GAMM|nr:bifunctional ADP-dependent NAD(P)H-hydrate dehydratase/NAD(P)H-hydrate epimerase [Psychrobacter piscatorii]KRU21856.1 NAD(P)H-hydrate dehydratase [Psychrobacter piscatorii]
MKNFTNLSPIKNTKPIALYSSEQIYAMEQAWFAQGYDSFGLMQQAAWQMAQQIELLYEQKCLNANHSANTNVYHRTERLRRVSVWVGKGNNGGDGWLIAHYLQQAGWQVEVIAVGFDKNDFVIDDKSVTSNSKHSDSSNITDATKALQIALSANCHYQRFEEIHSSHNESEKMALLAEIYIDALFGIGLDRAPEGIYKEAISAFNRTTQQQNALAVAVDIPSGLVASTGAVFDRIAVQADVTLCLIARKFGLHNKDGTDYSGDIIDIPLIPYQTARPHKISDKNAKQNTIEAFEPVAILRTAAQSMKPRRQNSYKGSYGHALIIGGNRVDGSQGMGGAAILSASSTMATGAGKITVACHEAFHGALLTSLPDAMTINLHDADGLKALIEQASVVAIGMGLGRDEKAKALFIDYIQTAIAHEKSIVIDADGLYHLASLQMDSHELVTELREHSINHRVCLTPHSGEAARLLDQKISEVESDRLRAIKQCAAVYGGDWVLKGAGSLVLEQKSGRARVYVCDAGNVGMATAGMGDILSGVIAGLLAQQDLAAESYSLPQAVLIHGFAGDVLVNQNSDCHSENRLMIGQRGLQAQDMPAAIRHVMQLVMVD